MKAMKLFRILPSFRRLARIFHSLAGRRRPSALSTKWRPLSQHYAILCHFSFFFERNFYHRERNEPQRKGLVLVPLCDLCIAIVKSHSFWRRFVRGMIVKGMGKRPCLAFIPLTIIPLTMAFPRRTHGARIGRGMFGRGIIQGFVSCPILCRTFPCRFLLFFGCGLPRWVIFFLF